MTKFPVKLSLAVGLTLTGLSVSVQASEPSNLYWGDTHLHTSYSPDAYMMQNRSAGPDVAYRYAKGLPVVHPYHKAKIKIGTPLDFLVVADHAELMGVIPKIFSGDPLVANTETGKRYVSMSKAGKFQDVFYEILTMINNNKPNKEIDNPEIRRSVWNDTMTAAERHNQPGKFTTFLGWEWSSIPDGANLHRVIFMQEGKKTGEKFIPFSSFDSNIPENMWTWLDKTAKQTGANFIAIPHNSNISKGLMFNEVDRSGQAITANYARTRMRWEPVVEVTQIKGDSETHPQLSPNDEFADYETFEHTLEVGKQNKEKPKAQKADYIRSALKRGLAIEQKTGVNPYQFGLIGSTDSHTAMASAEENNFWGKTAIDSTPASRKNVILPGVTGYDMGSAGLAAVWAKENTRDAIFDAFRRKEVYATTGPRIRVRFFGGWDFKSEDVNSRTLAAIGYYKGIPMGGNLAHAPQGKAPTFLIQAVKDPKGANLDRIQVVKGWLDADGKTQEKIFNVALSDARKEQNGRVVPVGNTVNLKTAHYSNSIGDPQLTTVWKDPSFKAEQRAFYYVRALQIPTPRHTLYDAVALNKEPPKGHATTIQERAYTSPIWYTP